MTDYFKLEKCSEDDALEFSFGDYRVKNLRQKFKNLFIEKTMHYLYASLKDINIDEINKYRIPYLDWFFSGVNCKILKVGATHWQQGKIKLKITLEFCPNEPEENTAESPLDDIRQMIRQQNKSSAANTNLME